MGKKLLRFLLCLLVASSGFISALAKDPVSQEEAVGIAWALIKSTKPSLELTPDAPLPGYVPAGSHSGGGPKWVIGFTAKNKKTGKTDIYYVTVFPDGRTDGQVREAPLS